MLASLAWAIHKSVKVISFAHELKTADFVFPFLLRQMHTTLCPACALTPFKNACKTSGDVFCVYSSCFARLKGDLDVASASV